MQTDALERLRKGVAVSVPLKAASKAEDVAGAAVFFASPAARHITGETLMIDAGTHLGYAPSRCAKACLGRLIRTAALG